MARTTWRELRTELLADPEVMAAYESAQQSARIGEAVRNARESAGLSQSELARLARTSQPAIARLEMGGVDPRMSTLLRVSRALGLDLDIHLITAKQR